MEESNTIKKTRVITQLLVLSITLNVGLLATFLYRSLTPKEVASVAKKETFSVSNGEMIYSYFHCSFDALVEKLSDERLVEEGYRVCDLALACLVSYHHFDLQRALPSTKLQKRHLLFVHAEGGEQIDVPVFPGLSMEDFSAISLFAKREEWPLTPKGLFLELARSEVKSLQEAFMLSAPFLAAQTLFSREGFALSREETLALLREGEWKTVRKIDQEKEFSRDQQLTILTMLTEQGSEKAARYLLQCDREYALRKLPDETLAKLVEKTRDPALVKEVATGVRADSVREVAKQHLKEELPAKKEVAYYIVKKGDTLWHIARRYDLSIKEIQKINNMGDADRIYPGKRLRLSE